MVGIPDDSIAVFKIVTAADWAEACLAGRYLGSDADRRDGYIHLSAAQQVAATAAKHFAGISGLLLVAFKSEALGSLLRWEPSRGGELFPHLYAPLPTGLAVWTRPLPLGQDGSPLVPEMLPSC